MYRPFHYTAGKGARVRDARKQEDRSAMLGLLWSSTRHHFPKVLPKTPPRERGGLKEGWQWQVGLGLLAASDIESLEWGKSTDPKQPFARQRTQSRRAGWLLWDSTHTTNAQGLVESTLFTPFYCRKEAQGTLYHSLLLDTVSWSTEKRGGGHFGLFYGLGLSNKRSVFEDGDTDSEFRLLAGALTLASDKRRSHTTSFANCAEKYTWKRHSTERAHLLGLLYYNEANLQHSEGPIEQQREESADNVRLASDKAGKRHSVSADTKLLLGLLYSRTLHDTRHWEYPRGAACPEQPTQTVRFKDTSSAFTPLVYSAERFRDGSFDRSNVFGLAYDHTLNVTEKTESFGILGYLFRSNLYADGTRERNLFPFLTTSSNERKGTRAFGFLHRFFRVEHTPNNTDVWFLWMRF